MNNTITGQLHCGACGEEFNNCIELNIHINTCPAAIVLLPLLYKQFDKRIGGHSYSCWLVILHKAQPLIKEYALAISNEIDNLSRSKIHLKLCELLHIDYQTFKPFESSAIKTIPTYEEAKKILWYALEETIRDTLKKEHPYAKELI